MNKIWNFRHILIILFVASVFRLFFLDRVPSDISDDELSYVVNAKAIWNTGRSMTSAWSPFGLVRNTSEFPFNEFPHLILAPVIGPMPFSLSWAHIPYALSNILLVFALYFFVKKTIGEREAFFVGLVAAINPWNIFFGRTSFDATLAISFFMISLCLTAYLKGKKILWLIIPLLLGFGSYVGTKTNFIPFVALCCYFGWRVISKKNYGKYYITVFLICTGLCLYFFSTYKTLSMSARTNELFTPGSSIVSTMVNDERRQSIQTVLTNVFANKPIVFFRLCIDKFFQSFSPGALFANGDYRATFSLYRHGYFYYIDVIFLFIGLYYLARKRKNVFIFLVSIVLIATIPIIASQAQTGFMAIRGLLFYPIFCIFIGLGIHTAIAVAEKGRYKNLFVGVLLIVYTILILNFINIYAFQFSIYSSESYSFSSRILSKYALFGSNENKKIVVYTTSPKERFIYYLFFSSLYENRLAGEIQNKFIRKEYSWKTVQFSYCDNDSTPQENTIYIIESGGCDKMKSLLTGPKKTIPILADGGSVYSIVGDSICDLYALSRYPNNLLFSDLSVENLTKERFCKAFITEIK